MKALCEPEELVIHPDKVMDVDVIIRRLLAPKLHSLAPSLIVMGAGSINSYYRDFRCDRELHRIISWFKFKGWNTKNIIALDIDKDICNAWRKEGITTFHGDWSNLSIIRGIRYKIDAIESEYGSRRILYANTYGSTADVKLYKSWLKILRPQYFLGLYSLRRAFTVQEIKAHMKSLSRYYPYDIGFMENTKETGLIGYKGLYMSVMKKKYGDKPICGRR